MSFYVIHKSNRQRANQIKGFQHIGLTPPIMLASGEKAMRMQQESGVATP